MEKLWIFGDSYSDPNSSLGKKSWVTEISKKYQVTNFSYRGTGPEWSYKKLLHQMQSNENLSDINLIFFISNPYRFDFQFYDDHQDHVLFRYFLSNEGLTGQSFLKMKKYEKHKKFCKSFIKNYAYSENFETEQIIKYIGALKLYESIFKKILVWPIFSSVDIPNSNSDKFFYVNTNLSSFEHGAPYGLETRANHLSPLNHQAMTTVLSDWVEKNQPIDIEKFSKIN